MGSDDKTRILSGAQIPSPEIAPSRAEGSGAAPAEAGAATNAAEKTELDVAGGQAHQNNAHRQASAGPNVNVASQDDATRMVGVAPSTVQRGADAAVPAMGGVIKGRFVPERLLGAGGMGVVYKALDQRKVEARDRDPYVAIKVLNEDFRRHPDSIISLQRESRKSQILAHPNIVNVYDFDRDGDMVFMTMEYLEGAPLDKLIKQSDGAGLEKTRALKIIRDVSEALIYAHSHDIVHSDFKPGNIFVTDKGIGKVFDFGIARAVSESRVETEFGERTLFDAGTLGALTPAYASLEMLSGQEPSTRDDVYALGCVAYETLSGRHPFDKKPADKARQLGLKPTRLPSLSRRQWRALERALAFERASRTATVTEFVADFLGKQRSPLWWVAGVVAIVCGVAVAYVQIQAREENLRRELAAQEASRLQEQQQQYMREKLDVLLEDGVLSPQWDREVKALLAEYTELVGEGHPSIAGYERIAAERYLQKVAEFRLQGELDQALDMLDRAKVWEPEHTHLSAEAARIAAAREREMQAIEVARMAAREERQRLAEQQRQRQEDLEKQRAQEQYRQALAAVESALRCSSDLGKNPDVKKNISGFKTRYPSQYRQQESKFIALLVSCVKSQARVDPFKADDIRQAAMRWFPGQQSLASIRLDYCGHLPAGEGRTCRDPMSGDARGPVLVVMPAVAAGQPRFAIGKYETSVGEMNPFCKETGACAVSAANASLPAHDLGVDTAEAYLKWLSEKTGFHYRLPSYREWLLAASGRDKKEDPNRNCHVRFGGIEKGLELVKVRTGKKNSYGIVHYSGNVQEWVLDNNQLLAAGGHHREPISRCTLSASRTHSGQADAVTGFRIARSLE